MRNPYHVRDTDEKGCERTVESSGVKLMVVTGLKLLTLAPEWMQLMIVGGTGGMALGWFLVVTGGTVRKYSVRIIDGNEEIMSLIADLPKTIYDTELERRSRLGQIKNRIEAQRASGIIGTGKSLSILLEITAVDDLVEQFLQKDVTEIDNSVVQELLKIINSVSNILEKYDDILDEKSKTDITFLLFEYKGVSTLIEAHVCLNIQLTDAGIALDIRGLNKTSNLLAELAEEYWKYIPKSMQEHAAKLTEELKAFFESCLKNNALLKYKHEFKIIKRILNSALSEIQEQTNGQSLLIESNEVFLFPSGLGSLFDEYSDCELINSVDIFKFVNQNAVLKKAIKETIDKIKEYFESNEIEKITLELVKDLDFQELNRLVICIYTKMDIETALDKLTDFKLDVWIDCVGDLLSKLSVDIVHEIPVD